MTPASRKTARRETRPLSAELIAEKAAIEAKAAGAVGSAARGRLTGLQKALRNSGILARNATGAKQKSIADEYQLSTRAVQAVIRDARLAPSTLDTRPMQTIEALLKSYQRTIADFQSLASWNVERNPQVTVSAMRAALDTQDRLWNLLSAVGLLPNDLSVFRQEVELLRLGGELVEVMHAVVRGDTTPEAALKFFEDLVLSDVRAELR